MPCNTHVLQCAVAHGRASGQRRPAILRLTVHVLQCHCSVLGFGLVWIGHGGSLGSATGHASQADLHLAGVEALHVLAQATRSLVVDVASVNGIPQRQHRNGSTALQGGSTGGPAPPATGASQGRGEALQACQPARSWGQTAAAAHVQSMPPSRGCRCFPGQPRCCLNTCPSTLRVTPPVSCGASRLVLNMEPCLAPTSARAWQ